jgi:hypothetical protein
VVQARERAKSKAALLEMLPRKRSSRVATKEERDKEEEEKRVLKYANTDILACLYISILIY